MADLMRHLENEAAVLANDAETLRRIAARPQYQALPDIPRQLNPIAETLDELRAVINRTIDNMYGPNGRPR